MQKSIGLRRSLVLPALMLLAALIPTGFAKADQIAYEGFMYDAGTGLTNVSTFTPGDSWGWARNWGAQSGAVAIATNVASSLSYTDVNGYNMYTEGGSVIVGRPNGIDGVGTGNAQLVRQINYGQGANGLNQPNGGMSNGTFYVSFLMQWVGVTNSTAAQALNAGALLSRQGGVHFRKGGVTNDGAGFSSGTQVFTIGHPNASEWGGGANTNGATPQWATWTGLDNIGNPGGGASASSNLGNIFTGNATWVLIRFDLGTGPGMDTAYTWINWTNLLVTPDIALATSVNTNNMDQINTIILQANGQNSGTNAVLQFDEIHIVSDDYFQLIVIPEPMTMAVGTLGGLALLALRRRKQ